MLSVTLIIGKRIKQLRSSRGLTQNQIASEVGISLRSMGQIERGEANPSLNTLLQLAAVFEVPLAEMLNYDAYSQSNHELRAFIINAVKEMNAQELRIMKLICEISKER